MSIKPDPRRIEVLITIDAYAIEVEPGPSFDEPVLLERADEYIAIVAPREFMKSSPPDSNLALAAVAGDVIQWRCAPFAPLQTSALLIDFKPVKGQDILSKPALAPDQKWTLVQRTEGQPLELVPKLYNDALWESTCQMPGKASYDVTFAVIEVGSQESTCVRGYYRWRSTIKITSSRTSR